MIVAVHWRTFRRMYRVGGWFRLQDGCVHLRVIGTRDLAWWWFLWTETCRIFNTDHYIYRVVLLNEHMYACKCVCMYYVRVCVCMYVSIYVCMYVCVYVCAHVTESWCRFVTKCCTLWTYSARPSRPRQVVQVHISTTIPRFSHPTTLSTYVFSILATESQ